MAATDLSSLAPPRADAAPSGGAPAGLAVAAGQIVALRLFDVANAIDLKRAEALWAGYAAGRAARLRLTGTPPKAVAFGEPPPLSLTLEPVALALGRETVEATTTARLYEFGAVSIAVRVPVAGRSWADYVALLNALDQAVGPLAGAAPWNRLLEHLLGIVAGALDRPTPSGLQEDYLIGVVQEFSATGPRPGAADILANLDLVPLLSGEQRPLSEAARADLLRSRFSYYADDLVVLTWDRAFIYEPRADTDVADVLEVANAQLLEMRYYDELLDAELPRMYELVTETRRGLNVLASRRYATLARRLYTLVAEVTQLTERIDNALQVTEDVYLARVYAAALDLFRVPTVSAAVDRKLAIIRDTYTALYDEANSSRSELMEAAIVLLIVVEVVLAVMGK